MKRPKDWIEEGHTRCGRCGETVHSGRPIYGIPVCSSCVPLPCRGKILAEPS